MVRSILAKITFALPLLLAIPAVAQSPFQIQLTVPSIGGYYCGKIGQEVITDANGNNVPYNINQIAGGYSDDVCNNDNGVPMSISLPPQPSEIVIQPEWVEITPPLAACTDGVVNCLVRGPLPDPRLFSKGATTTTQDNFKYLFSYEDYEVKYVQFAGSNTRNWLLVLGYRGVHVWEEQSATVNMSATLLN